MKTIWSEKVDEVLKIGRCLESIGIKNWALEKKEALCVLRQFLDLGIPVLGGDVYVEKNNTIESTYDSWHCDLALAESQLEFIIRSNVVARNYIETYLVDTNPVLFALVPKI